VSSRSIGKLGQGSLKAKIIPETAWIYIEQVVIEQYPMGFASLYR